MPTPAAIPGDNETIRQALADVNLPNLLMVIACLTESDDWLHDRFKPAPVGAPEGSLFPDDTGRYAPDIAAEIVDTAIKLIAEVRDGERDVPAPPDAQRLQKLLSFSMAEEVNAGYAQMLMDETGFNNRDARWQQTLAERPSPPEFNAVIIGAGMSGLGMAAKLAAAGIPFTIIEKNEAVGGTWFENTYPDCGVDTPNHYYSYSFNRNAEWSGYFSKRDELFAYFNRCADDFDVRQHVQFNTEVTSAHYDVQQQQWNVKTRTSDGHETTLNCSILVSAVGQLNRPSVPDIKGLDSFNGATWHSARWPDNVDLAGKRVGVIGTGCSCVQLLPKTAEQAGHTSVFQRTPHWVAPARDYYKAVEPGQLWALKHIPFYAEFHRARMILTFGDRVWDAVVADPDWAQQDVSLNEANHGMREALIGFIEEGLAEKPHYVEHCTPNFPVWGKRLIVDNGWYPTLARTDVDLVTEGIAEVEAGGIRTEDGTLHELDVLILATGFESNKFLWPMEIVGAAGQTLADVWGDHANAYKGVSVPGFPNLFCLYGPNTNIVHGGSIIYQVECQLNYVMQCIASMASKQISAIDVRDDVNQAYNDKVQALSRNLAWGHPNVASWYKNADGQVINNSPFSLQEYWEVTREVDLDDYHLHHPGDNAAS